MKKSCDHPVICGNDSGGWFCGTCNANISRYYVNRYIRGREPKKRKP